MPDCCWKGMLPKKLREIKKPPGRQDGTRCRPISKKGWTKSVTRSPTPRQRSLSQREWEIWIARKRRSYLFYSLVKGLVAESLVISFFSYISIFVLWFFPSQLRGREEALKSAQLDLEKKQAASHAKLREELALLRSEADVERQKLVASGEDAYRHALNRAREVEALADTKLIGARQAEAAIQAKQRSAEQACADAAAAQQRLVVEEALYAPKRADLEAQLALVAGKRSEVETAAAEVEQARQELSDDRKALTAQQAALSTAQAELERAQGTVRVQSDANRASANALAVASTEIDLEKGRLATLKGSLAMQASEFAGCLRLMHRFKRTLLRQAELTAAIGGSSSSNQLTTNEHASTQQGRNGAALAITAPYEVRDFLSLTFSLKYCILKYREWKASDVKMMLVRFNHCYFNHFFHTEN